MSRGDVDVVRPEVSRPAGDRRARHRAVSDVVRTVLRARRAQAALLAVVVAGVVAVAGLLPLVTASIGRAMVDHRVQQLGPMGRSVEVRALRPDSLIRTDRIANLLGDQWDGVAGPQVGQYRVVTSGLPIGTEREVTLLDRQGQCRHIRLVAGSCPQGRFQVAVSSKSAAAWGLALGDRPRVTQQASQRQPINRTLTVVGVFEQDARDPFWRGLDVGSVTTQGEIQRHTWLTAPETFSGPAPAPVSGAQQPSGRDAETATGVGWSGVETTVSRTLLPGAFSYDRLDQARAAVQHTEDQIAVSGIDAQLTEQVSAVDGLVRDDLDQLRVIGPLLIAQLLVLHLLLGSIVLGAMATQRRAEVAIIRLRSPGRSGAAAVLRGELLPPILIGLPIGLATALAVDWGVRTVWLSGTDFGGWTSPAVVQAFVAGLIALAVCLGASLWTVRRLVRQPISRLLRSVPPRARRWSLSAPEIVLLTLALGLVAAVVTGSLSGPAVLITPVAAAVAVGLVVAGLLIPSANRASGRLLRRGRVSPLLALTSLARRPSSKHVLLALTAAGAMITFAVATLQLGAQNREALAQAGNGASVRLVANDSGFLDPVRFVTAINDLDPEHRSIAPVWRIQSGSSDGPVTVAADPRAMSRLAQRAGGGDPWSALIGSRNESPAVVGAWSRPSPDPGFTAPSLGGVDRTYTVVGTVPFIPGVGQHGFITPLQPLLSGASATAFATAEVWSDGSDPAMLRRAGETIRRLGYDQVTTVRTADQVRDLDHSASAYGLQLGVLVAVGALVVGILVLAAVLSAQRSRRHLDEVALRSAGVPTGTLRRARVSEAMLLVAPLLLGGVTGWLCAWLAAPGIPWYAVDPGFEVASRVPPPGWAAVSIALAVAVSALLAFTGLRASVRQPR